ncbi:uncharacterized protein FFNC_15550 [Fusarium fujikuroi]|nr:uncharacterized protein FFNC_15550 [Fusarium fujikuroi]
MVGPELRRKTPFCRERQPIGRATPALYYENRDPKLDYFPPIPSKTSRKTWIAQHRDNGIRQLVTIRELQTTRIRNIRQLTSVAHPNIAEPLSFYQTGERLFVVHRFISLELFDLLPLWPREIASAMKQFVLGVQFLMNSGVMFSIEVVQIGLDGVIKIVLDWNLEPEVGKAVREANRQYILPYIQNMMVIMTASSQGLPESAQSFAYSPILPDIDHPFISGAGGPATLRKAAEFAQQKQVLAARTGQVCDNLSSPYACTSSAGVDL